MRTCVWVCGFVGVAFALSACSPSEPPKETFLDSQMQALDKAKQVEKLGAERDKQLDKLESQAN